MKNVIGSQIIQIDSNGNTQNFCYGYADRSQKRIVTPTTLFQAASLSKVVTAGIVLLLHQKGRLDIHAPVKSYVAPSLRSRIPNNITFAHLLSHTSGANVHGFSGYTTTQLPTVLQILQGKNTNTPRLAFIYPLGEYHYSGMGYEILQHCIEQIERRPLADIAKELLFSPLGMNDTTFLLQDYRKPHQTIAVGYLQSGRRVRNSWRLHPESSAAGLWTHATDFAKYIRELQKAYHGKSQIFSRATIHMMMEPQARVDTRESVGLGVFLDAATTSFTHDGWNAGFRCRFRASLLKSQALVVIFTNSDSALPIINKVVHRQR